MVRASGRFVTTREMTALVEAERVRARHNLAPMLPPIILPENNLFSVYRSLSPQVLHQQQQLNIHQSNHDNVQQSQWQLQSPNLQQAQWPIQPPQFPLNQLTLPNTVSLNNTSVLSVSSPEVSSTSTSMNSQSFGMNKAPSNVKSEEIEMLTESE